jgi:hypothetical protein
MFLEEKTTNLTISRFCDYILINGSKTKAFVSSLPDAGCLKSRLWNLVFNNLMWQRSMAPRPFR